MDDFFVMGCIVGVIFIIAIGSLSVIFIDGNIKLYETRQACNKIGMEYYTSMDSIFCLDNNNKAHYVKIECERLGLMEYDCSPRLISIGDVRTMDID